MQKISLLDDCFWILHLPEGYCDYNYEPQAKCLFRSILTAIYVFFFKKQIRTISSASNRSSRLSAFWFIYIFSVNFNIKLSFELFCILSLNRLGSMVYFSNLPSKFQWQEIKETWMKGRDDTDLLIIFLQLSRCGRWLFLRVLQVWVIGRLGCKSTINRKEWNINYHPEMTLMNHN